MLGRLRFRYTDSPVYRLTGMPTHRDADSPSIPTHRGTDSPRIPTHRDTDSPSMPTQNPGYRLMGMPKRCRTWSEVERTIVRLRVACGVEKHHKCQLGSTINAASLLIGIVADFFRTLFLFLDEFRLGGPVRRQALECGIEQVLPLKAHCPSPKKFRDIPEFERHKGKVVFPK